METDLSKPVQTRDGRAVRIICTDRKHVGHPVVALVSRPRTSADQSEEAVVYRADGTLSAWEPGSSLDLINVPLKEEARLITQNVVMRFPAFNTDPENWEHIVCQVRESDGWRRAGWEHASPEPFAMEVTLKAGKVVAVALWPTHV